MSGFPYVIPDEIAYIDRQERMRAATHGKVLDRRVMESILREVDPLPWVLGRWYRIRLMAGAPHMRHAHGVDEAGVEHAIDIPQLASVEWMELEVSPLGRELTFVGQRHVPPMLFRLRDKRRALFADVDIAEAAEVPA